MTNMSWLKRLSKYAGAHAPEILIGVGIASGIGAVVTAVSATVKAASIIEKRKAEKDTLTKKEIVAVVWKNYIPTAGAVILSVGCIVAANTVNRKRSAALAATYALSETAFSAYKQSVADEFGVEKEYAISDKAIQKQIIDKPVKSSKVITIENGEVLTYDTFSGRYFKSSKNGILSAVNELNRLIINDGGATLNDFYDLIGLDNVQMGDILGWLYDQKSISIRFSSHLTTDGEPCMSFAFNVMPHTEVDHYY